MDDNCLQFRSWGFQLFLPPTAFASSASDTNEAEVANFVMVDDINNVFYRVDYATVTLGNKTPWTALAMHRIAEPAIVFPPEQQDMLYQGIVAIGLLVSIESRTQACIKAKKLGRVFVARFPQELMNWQALQDLKGNELVDEVRTGLLRRLWNRHSEHTSENVTYVTPSRVVNAMSNSWHDDGEAMNDELDYRFAGAETIGPPSRWNVSGLSYDEIKVSKARAAVFVDETVV